MRTTGTAVRAARIQFPRVITVRAYANCDDVYLAWRTEASIPDCRGFALYRERNGKEEIVSTWVGFEGESSPAGTRKPSTQWPIQKYMWVDYMAAGGDTVRYRVVPMVGSKNNLNPALDLASSWTSAITVGAQPKSRIAAFFNRGIVAAQWVSRRLGPVRGAQQKLERIIATPGDRTRDYLSGPLREQMLKLLREARSRRLEIYAALYELNDPELLNELATLGKRAHIILANGSVKKKTEDGNAEARAFLAGRVDLHGRMTSSGRLAHDKFVVFCSETWVPERVWTGSTNWSETGLCTQANNGLLIGDGRIAAYFYKQWEDLKDAGDGFPAELTAANSRKKMASLRHANVSIWFTPVAGEVDLEEAREIIHHAQQGILFCMFNPGPRGTLLNAIIERNEQSKSEGKELYIHGIVNQDPSTKKTKVVGLFHRGELNEGTYEVVLPAALETDKRPGYWSAEIRKYHKGWAMVHSKVVVIDPFGRSPIVITGSHNLGPKASGRNNDNLAIIKGDADLAAAYAVNLMSIYNQYRWRYMQLQYPALQNYNGLKDNDEWQNSYFRGAKARELQFWLGEA